ncbi:hypothetical protein KR018_011897, partial [Drosophila ironensis]
NAIRKTWKYYDFRQDIGIAFVLGRSNSEYDIKRLDLENLMYADIIRGNSIDSYMNLTLKTISLLEWAHLHCPYAKYVLKTDDDVFINVPRLLSFIDKNKAKRKIFGRRAKHWQPVRNRASKYYLSINDYPASTFPDFTTGPAYLLTGDIVHELYKKSLHLLYLKLEDVYITGIVAEMLGIERVNVQEIYNLPYNLKTCNVHAWISYHMVEPHMQFKLWQKLFNESLEDVFITGIVAEMLDIERLNVQKIYNLPYNLKTCNVRAWISYHMVEPHMQFKLWQKLFDGSVKVI